MVQAFMELVRNQEVTGKEWPGRLALGTRRDGVMTGRPREAGGKDSKKLHAAVDSMAAFRGNELGTGILEFG